MLPKSVKYPYRSMRLSAQKVLKYCKSRPISASASDYGAISLR